jgi:hypothetical protein
MTATDINYALGKLYKAIAQNRIPPRNASNLAFVGKLLLLALDKLKKEFGFSYDYEEWKKMYLESKPLSNPPSATHGQQQPANGVAIVGSSVEIAGSDVKTVRSDVETSAGPGKDDPGGPA